MHPIVPLADKGAHSTLGERCDPTPKDHGGRGEALTNPNDPGEAAVRGWGQKTLEAAVRGWAGVRKGALGRRALDV